MKKIFLAALAFSLLAWLFAAPQTLAAAPSAKVDVILPVGGAYEPDFKRLTLAPFIEVSGEDEKKPAPKPGQEDETVPVTPPDSLGGGEGDASPKGDAPPDGDVKVSVICGLPPADVPEAAGAERRPLKIALVPVVDRTRGGLTERAAMYIASRLDRELHVPLNDAMHWVQFVPESTSEDAFKRAAAGSKRMDEAPRRMAEELSLDLSVAVIVDTFYERNFFGFRGYDIVESSVSLRVIGYDAKTGRTIRERASGWDRDELGSAKSADELLADALDEALAKARLKDAIFPLGR